MQGLFHGISHGIYWGVGLVYRDTGRKGNLMIVTDKFCELLSQLTGQIGHLVPWSNEKKVVSAGKHRVCIVKFF